MKDQNGTVHRYLFDGQGRQVSDRVIEVGAGIDTTVRRIDQAYNRRGLLARITSYAEPEGRTTLNEVRRQYNGLDMLVAESQQHVGAVGADSPVVTYAYDETAASGLYTNGLRPVSLTYPNGRTIQFTYGVSGSAADQLNRLDTIKDSDGTPLSSYSYLGLSTIVIEDYLQRQIRLDYFGGTSGAYAGSDAFGRVVQQLWASYASSPAVALDEYSYTYDQAGNRTSRDNALNPGLDEAYQYDDLDRLTSWSLGGTQQQAWSLDALGNDLSSGTYNVANEEAPTTGSSGYDLAGNMTALQSGDAAVYDAWNRLVEVSNSSGIVEQYEYDGTNRRIEISSYFSGSVPTAVTTDYYAKQQVVESDITSGSQAVGGYQYVWSPRYIDAPVLRDTLNTAGTGIVAADRVYYLDDANYNVTGLVTLNTSTENWSVAERYTYTPYGVLTYRNADWTTATSSVNANTVLYTGRTVDLATGLYYYRARYYDAGLERFISRDPSGYSAGTNLYGYVGDNPGMRTDPTGEDLESDYRWFAAKKCACDCGLAALNIAAEGTMTQILNDAKPYIQKNLPSVNFDSSAYYAVLDCIGNGILTSMSGSCECAACLAKARAEFMPTRKDSGWDSKRATNALANYKQGRRAAGCGGENANWNPGSWGPGGPWGPEWHPEPLADKDKVCQSCKAMFLAGQLKTS